MSEARPRPASRRVATIVATVAAFAVAAAAAWGATMLVFSLSAYGTEELHPRRFDAALWNAPDWRDSESEASHFHSIRQRMVDDLLATRLVPGLAQVEVVALIGEPDADPRVRAPHPDAWTYRLGNERGRGVRNEWLLVSFDEHGFLQRAHLATD